MVRYGDFYIHQSVNNPGHWMHNGEIWAALAEAVPPEMKYPPSENGYVRPPFARVGSGYFYENQIAAGRPTEREAQAINLVEINKAALTRAAIKFKNEARNEAEELFDLSSFWREKGNPENE